MVRIAPSLLSADFARLAAEVEEIHQAGADMLHLDIMDGHFVPNLTFGPMVVRAISATSTITLDTHLMVRHPDALVGELADAGADRVAVHVETCDHLHRTIFKIRDLGMRAGIAINPGTALVSLSEALDWIDFVLVMSVNPGFGGQAFIPASIAKVKRLHDLIGDRPVDITVDGGVDPSNTAALVEAGATTLVAGSSVFGAPDRARAIAALRAAPEEGDNA